MNKSKKDNKKKPKKELNQEDKKNFKADTKVINQEISKKKTIVLKIIFYIFLIIILFTASSLTFCYCYIRKSKEIKNSEITLLKEQYQEAFIDYQEKIEYGTTWNYEDFLTNLIDSKKLDSSVNLNLEINSEKLIKDSSYKFMNSKETVKITINRDYQYQILNKNYQTNIEVEKTIDLTIEDTKLPTITGISDKEITVGSAIDLKSGISASDEVDGELEIVIEGEVDTNKVGVYTIKVSATDKNNNTKTEEFKVTVKEKPKVNSQSKNNNTSSSNSNNTSNSNTNSNTNTNTSSKNDTSTKDGRLNLAKAEAKRVVSNIIKPGMSDYEKAYAIMMYIFQSVEVQHNQSTEAYKTNFGNEAYAALILKIAACSGRCKAITLLCDAAGLKSQHINKDLWTHQWNKVLIDGKWVVLDSQIGLLGGDKHPFED